MLLLFPPDVQKALLRGIEQPPPRRVRGYGLAYGSLISGLAAVFLCVGTLGFEPMWLLPLALLLGATVCAVLGFTFPRVALKAVRPLFVDLTGAGAKGEA